MAVIFIGIHQTKLPRKINIHIYMYIVLIIMQKTWIYQFETLWHFDTIFKTHFCIRFMPAGVDIKMRVGCVIVNINTTWYGMQHLQWNIYTSFYFVLCCFIEIISYFLADWCVSFTHILRGWFTGTSQCEWSNHERYEQNSSSRQNTAKRKRRVYLLGCIIKCQKLILRVREGQST